MSEFRPIISIVLSIVLVLSLIGVVQILKKGVYEAGDYIYFVVDEDSSPITYTGDGEVISCDKPNRNPDLPRVRTTAYYTPYEGDFSSWISFYKDVKLQGSGITIRGLICRYYNIKKTKEASGCLDPKNGKVGSRGVTATGSNPTSHRTIATDPGVIPLHSLIYVEYDNTDNPWNGCYRAEDTGGAIKGNHIDVYVGVGKEELNKAAKEKQDYAKLWIVKRGK